MKLKGLGNRAYNVMFHTHTVAGIVISFALFVIFYAGAFSLFRHDVAQWENPDRRQPLMEELDYDKVLAKVDSVYELNFHEITNFVFPSEEDPLFYVYGAYSDTDTTTKRMRAYVSPQDLHIQDIDDPKTTASLTIYY
ncbi:MAG: PepSY-associated TM helix domain-containing protein, partial [Bacteroidota bacterium]